MINKIIFIRTIKNFIKFNFYPDSKLTKDITFILKINKISKPLIFDVGAYQGNWINNYLRKFPKLKGYLFEPYEESFKLLKKRFKNNSRLKIFNVAVSSESSYLDVNVNTKAYTNSLLDLDPLASDSWENDELIHKEKVKVKVINLDSFYSEISNKNKRINLLKIDVQGNELRVLDGCKEFFANKFIDIILIEILVAPTYKSQSKISQLFNFFENYNFDLFGIYDIEKSNKYGKIQQFDALFIRNGLKIK